MAPTEWFLPATHLAVHVCIFATNAHYLVIPSHTRSIYLNIHRIQCLRRRTIIERQLSYNSARCMCFNNTNIHCLRTPYGTYITYKYMCLFGSLGYWECSDSRAMFAYQHIITIITIIISKPPEGSNMLLVFANKIVATHRTQHILSRHNTAHLAWCNIFSRWGEGKSGVERL